jgi:hypothetical protein
MCNLATATPTASSKPSDREDAPQIRTAVIEQAQARGFSKNEAETLADSFFKTWDDQGYDAAFNRFLNRVV